MRFARFVFAIAGIWGIVVLTPFYWLVDITGRAYAAPTEYPHFFYGFFWVAMVWQIVFLLIAMRPAELRPMMIPAVLEKLGFVTLTLSLYFRGRISWLDAQSAVPDLLLGVLFVAAFFRTRSARPPAP
jgi:hypothetical protein